MSQTVFFAHRQSTGIPFPKFHSPWRTCVARFFYLLLFNFLTSLSRPFDSSQQVLLRSKASAEEDASKSYVSLPGPFTCGYAALLLSSAVIGAFKYISPLLCPVLSA